METCIMDSYREKFNQFYKDHIDRYGKQFVLPNDWFDKVEAVHASLRKSIGGDITSRLVECNIESDIIPNSPEATDLQNHLFYTIPNYFYHYGFSLSSILYPKIPSPRFAKLSWTKHINVWMQRHGVKEHTVKLANDYLSQLERLRQQTQKTTKSLYVSMVTAPEIFVSLGHFENCDTKSCFKENGANVVHKYIIGQTPGTFVIIIHKDPINGDINPDDVLCRYWGVATEDNRVFTVTNKYGDDEVNYDYYVDMFFKNIFNEEVKIQLNQVFIEGAYQNFVPTRTYSLVDHVVMQKFVTMDDTGLGEFRQCCSCGRKGKIAITVDRLSYCEKCIPRRRYECSITKQFYSDISTVIIDGKALNVSTRHAKTFCHQCDYDGKFYPKEDCKVNSTGCRLGPRGIKHYLETGNMICPECGIIVPKTEKCQICNNELVLSVQ